MAPVDSDRDVRVSGRQEDVKDVKDVKGDPDENFRMEDLLAPIVLPSEGEVIRSTVVHIGADSIAVDIGFKAEGFIPRKELVDETGLLTIAVGDTIDVVLQKREGPDGHPLVSHLRGKEQGAWGQLRDALSTGVLLEGTITAKTRGGLMVQIGTEQAFMPASQTDVVYIKDLGVLIGQTVQVKVTELNWKRRNIVVSRRAVIDEDRKRRRDDTMKELKVGDVVEGKVKNLTAFGAFVDVGGIDGLLHVSDLAWRHVKKPDEVVKPGETIRVKVLAFDAAEGRISLGLKQLQEHPWEKVAQKYPPGTQITGRVSSLTNFGAFIEVEPGLEGLLHVSELSWTQRVNHPKEVLAIGQEVTAAVLKVDPEQRRLSLGIKQLTTSPWDGALDRYKVGQKVSGVVSRLTPFGGFLRMDDGLEGLIRTQDLAWSTDVKHPRDVLKVGDRVDTVVLEVEPKSQKLALGIRQLQPDPMDDFSIGQNVSGRVTKVTEFGVFVDLVGGLEGLLHVGQIPPQKDATLESRFPVGSEVQAQVIKLHRDKRKIDLSVSKMEKEQHKDALAKFQKSQPSKPTLGDLLVERAESEQAPQGHVGDTPRREAE